MKTLSKIEFCTAEISSLSELSKFSLLPGIISEGVKVSNLSEGRPVVGTHLTVIIRAGGYGHKSKKVFCVYFKILA